MRPRLPGSRRCWKIDPTAPEAGSNILTLYYGAGRGGESRRLVLRLYRVEPDTHDRAVPLLLELLRARRAYPCTCLDRENTGTSAPAQSRRPFILAWLWAWHKSVPTRSKWESEQLRRVVQTHPDRVEAWNGPPDGPR